MPILNIEIPANGMEFFSIAVPIVTYDILENFEPYNDFLEYLTRSQDTNKTSEENDKRRL